MVQEQINAPEYSYRLKIGLDKVTDLCYLVLFYEGSKGGKLCGSINGISLVQYDINWNGVFKWRFR